MQISQTYEPKSQKSLRNWYEKYHISKSEIWLVFYKKSSGKQTVSYRQALDEALCFGWIDGIEKSIDNERYALRFTLRRNISKWSEYNVKRFEELLKKGVVTNAGKLAYKNKGEVYTAHSMTKEAVAWHLAHKMPKNPTLEERLAWHREHKKHCGCRPIPKSLEPYL